MKYYKWIKEVIKGIYGNDRINRMYLFTRERRGGKSLNISMVQYLFENGK